MFNNISKLGKILSKIELQTIKGMVKLLPPPTCNSSQQCAANYCCAGGEGCVLINNTDGIACK